MQIKTYDYNSGGLINDPASELDFGDVTQGQHCYRPLLIRTFPDTETTIFGLKLYLESKGGWTEAEFGYYTNAAFTPSIEAGSELLSNHLVEVPNATAASPNGISIPTASSISDYVWLDVDLPTTQVGVTEANYRFTFNYT